MEQAPSVALQVHEAGFAAFPRFICCRRQMCEMPCTALLMDGYVVSSKNRWRTSLTCCGLTSMGMSTLWGLSPNPWH